MKDLAINFLFLSFFLSFLSRAVHLQIITVNVLIIFLMHEGNLERVQFNIKCMPMNYFASFICKNYIMSASIVCSIDSKDLSCYDNRIIFMIVCFRILQSQYLLIRVIRSFAWKNLILVVFILIKNYRRINYIFDSWRVIVASIVISGLYYRLLSCKSP